MNEGARKLKYRSRPKKSIKTPSSSCPICNLSDGTTIHLFNCSSFHTDLSTLDLWQRPILASKFLETHPSFPDLPPLPSGFPDDPACLFPFPTKSQIQT